MATLGMSHNCHEINCRVFRRDGRMVCWDFYSKICTLLIITLSSFDCGIMASIIEINKQFIRILTKIKSDSLSEGHKISTKRERGIKRDRTFSYYRLFLIPPRLNPKVKLFRLAIHYLRLICRNYFADGELPLKRRL